MKRGFGVPDKFFRPEQKGATVSEERLFLSNDRAYVMDADGKVVYVRTEMDGHEYYVEPTLDIRIKYKACVEVSSKKICVEWNQEKYCIGWDTIEVCVRWEVVEV